MVTIKPIVRKSTDANKILIYTDGASRITGNKKGGEVQPNDLAACSFFMKYNDLEKLEGHAFKGFTNNRMEMLAVVEALKAVKNTKFPVVVHSDSALIINAINNHWYKRWRENGWDKKGGLKNADLWQQMIEQIERFRFIQFVKVKGHSGNQDYNQLVDDKNNEEMDKLRDMGENYYEQQ